MDTQSKIDNARLHASQDEMHIALSILRGILKYEPDNEEAWLLLSKYFQSKKRIIFCLDQVLRINPHNEHARNLLSQINPIEDYDLYDKREENVINGLDISQNELTSSYTNKVCPVCSEEQKSGVVTCFYCGHEFKVVRPLWENLPGKSTASLIDRYHKSVINQDQQTKNYMQRTWLTFVAGDEFTSIRYLAKLAGQEISSTEVSNQIARAKLLRSYNFAALQNIPWEARQELALVAAWRSLLMFGFNGEEIEKKLWVWDKTEPLAAIIGFDYDLSIDTGLISKSMLGKNFGGNYFQNLIDPPVSYDIWHKKWPALRSLQSISITARTAFIRAIRYVKSNGLVAYRHIAPDGLSESVCGMDELIVAGIVNMKPELSSRLLNLSIKELKKFAFAQGIKTQKTKFDLSNAICDLVGIKEIENFLSSFDDDRYIEILINDIPLLKKQIYHEIYRFDLYIDWIEYINGLYLPPTIKGFLYETEKRDVMKWHYGDINIYKRPAHDLLSQQQLQILRGIWNSNCDEMLKKLVNKYSWDAYIYIGREIQNYIPRDHLQVFIQACEKKGWGAWYNILPHYGIIRISELGIKITSPEIKVCARCGTKFNEASVRPFLSRSVGYKILYCGDCYFKVLNGAGRPFSMNRKTMLQKLADFAEVLEAVPTATFYQMPDLSDVNEEKQLALITLLFDMPIYATYIESFGSWLKALIDAEILDDGTMRLSRGTQCIAKDGHICLSLAEKTIDDWLSGHNIKHAKEPLYPHHNHLNPSGNKRGDWKVGDVFIEYAGLTDDPDYFARLQEKQKLANELEIQLIILIPEDILKIERKLGMFEKV